MKMERKNKNEKKRKGNSSSSSSLKVVYISSPMKVKTTASRFRALVQELTGRDSDITRSMDIVENCNNFIDFESVLPHQKGKKNVAKSVIPDEDQYYQYQEELQYFSSSSPVETQYQDQELQYFSSSSPVETTRDSPTSSESLIEQQEVFGTCEAFLSSEQVEDQFLEDMFSSSLFSEQYSQSHLLEGYDAL